MEAETFAQRVSRTKGREATRGVIPGRFALSVGMPSLPSPRNWKWTALSDVAQLESGHTPSRKHPEYWNEGIPWIGIKDAVDGHGREIFETYQHVSRLGLDNSSARLLPERTVCLSRTASVGYVVVMGRSMATSQDFVNWVCGPNLEPDYLKYILLAERDSLLQFASGTTHQTIYYPEAKAFHALLPPVSEQRQILHILESIDRKIELNRKMNETLEAMARALFKSWFVDFDPVRAKAAGKQPSGMDAETAKLFPSRFVQSELGEVPEGWSQMPLYDIATYINGAAYKAFEPNSEGRGLPIIKIAELKAGVTSQTQYSDVQMPEKYRLRTGDILFSWSGNPDTSIDTFIWSHGPAWLNQHIFRVDPLRSKERSFVLATLKYLRPVFAEIARNKQTTGLGHVTAGDMQRLPVMKPADAIIVAWNDVAKPIFDAVLRNTLEAQELARLRDVLLPKLLSGELPVPTSVATAIAAHATTEGSRQASPVISKKEKKASDEFVEAILIAQLVQRFSSSDRPLGRMRRTKLAYLAHRKAEDDVQQQYMKKAAGPYDPWSKYQGPEKIARGKKYVKEIRTSAATGLVAGEKIGEIQKYVGRYTVCESMEWLETFRYRKNEELELLSTVDFAALELRKFGKAVNGKAIKDIIASNEEWKAKLGREIFADEKIDAALVELSKLFPSSYDAAMA